MPKNRQEPSPKGVRHVLADNATEVIALQDWIVTNKEEENLIAWISSDKGKGHTHRIYRLSKDELGGRTGRKFAEDLYTQITQGDKILETTEWLQGESHGAEAWRISTRLLTDVSGDEEKEHVWLIVESKDFDDRSYIQAVYHQHPFPREKLKSISLVLNSVRPIKSAGEQAGAEQPATAPKPKPEGKENPKPDTEARSR